MNRRVMDEDRKKVEIVYGGITLREALKVVVAIVLPLLVLWLFSL